ncbi:MAG: hypothetical protein U0235_17025 [Polyangiaceae bacterium]
MTASPGASGVSSTSAMPMPSGTDARRTTAMSGASIFAVVSEAAQ